MKILFTSEEVVDICQGHYYSRNLQQHIDKYRYLGDITCMCYSREAEKTILSRVEKQSANFVFIPKSNSIKTFYQNSIKRKSLIKKIMSEFDMLVCHVPSSNSYPAIEYAKEMGKPYLLVVVGCAWDALWNYDWRGKLLAPFAYFKLKSVVKEAPYTIYVTSHFLQKRYPCKGKTIHASNVCLSDVPEEILNRRLEFIKNKRISEPINIVTTAAVDVRYKGQEYVINALKILNIEQGGNYHYYLLGGGNQSFLKKYAAKLGVTPYVHFLGSLSHDKVLTMLDNMDIYIQPSKQEGLPRALIEAMSRALPAIGTNIAGIPELLSKDYLVRKSSVHDIIEVITNKMNSQSLMQQAVLNFNNAKEYKMDIINKRRQEFFDMFLKESSF